MISFFKYLFYRIYSWELKTSGESNDPHYNALLGVSFLMGCNLIAIMQLFSIVFFNTPFPTTKNNLLKLLIIVVGLIVLFVNYLLFIKGGKHRELADLFKHETTTKRTSRTIKITLYVSLSFLIPVLIALLFHKYKSL